MCKCSGKKKQLDQYVVSDHTFGTPSCFELLVRLVAYDLPQHNQSSRHIHDLHAALNSPLPQFSTERQTYWCTSVNLKNLPINSSWIGRLANHRLFRNTLHRTVTDLIQLLEDNCYPSISNTPRIKRPCLRSSYACITSSRGYCRVIMLPSGSFPFK